jgi:hypothetical protein
MKPIVHARLSAKKYGGSVEDFLPIHDFLDSSKAVLPDIRHRAIFHNSLGPFVAERIFGTTVKNANGLLVCVRDIAEDHIIEDIGFIPTITRWLEQMKIEPWMAGGVSRYRKLNLPQPETEDKKQFLVET